jgi:PAS domain S-box-containing protein
MRDELPLEEALNQLNRQMMVINTLAAEINQPLDLEKILNYSLDKTIEIIGVDFAGILLVSRDQTLIPKVLKGVPSERVREIQEHRLTIQGGLEGQVIRSKQPVIVEDLTEGARGYKEKNIFESLQICSYLGVPILSLDKVWGVISIGSRKKESFTRRDVEFLSTLAHHIGIAVKSARHHQREKELFLLAKSQQLITSSLNLQEVLTFIVDACADLMEVPACHIRLLNEDQELIFAAASGVYKDSLEEFRKLKIGESFSGWVVAHGETLMVPDAASDERNVHIHITKKYGLKSFLGVPLKIREKVIGVLGVSANQTRQFSEEEIQLVSNFANQAAIAIENARLFGESEKRRQEAEASRRDLETAMQIVRQSEDRFRNIYNAISSGIVVQDGEGKVIYANEAACKLLGQTLDQLQGKAPVDPGWHAIREDGPPLPFEEYPIMMALHTGKPVRNAVMGICSAKNEKPRWILGNCEPILDPDTGRVKEVVGSFIDITERKQAAEKLRQQNDYLAALHETTLALMNRLELHDLLEVIITRAGELLGTQHGYVHLLGSKGTEMIVGIGIYSQRIDYGVRPGKGLVGKIWQTGQPLVVDNYSTWPERLPDPQLDLIHAQIGVPLKSGSEVVGVIGLAYLGEGRTFGDEEIALLSRFAGLASIALDNARLYAAAQQELAERKRTEEKLRQNETRLRTILDSEPECVKIISLSGTLLEINPAGLSMVEARSGEEVIGKPVIDLVHPEDRMAFQRFHQLVSEGQAGTLQFRIIGLRGGLRWMEAHSVPLRDHQDRVVSILNVAHDITERKRTEEKLHQQNEYLTALHETALGLMNRLNLNDLLEAIIMRAGALAGTPHGDIFLLEPGGTEMKRVIGTGIFSNLLGYRVRWGEGQVGKVWQTGQPLALKDYHIWPDRLPDPDFDVLRASMVVPLKSGSEVVGVIGLVHVEEGRIFGDDEIALLGQFAELASIALDNARLYTAVQQELAERKRAEEALRKSEERLQAILDNSPAVIYVKDTRYRYLLVNRRYETLTRLPREQITGKTDYELFPKEIADAFRINDEKVLTARTSLEFEEICLQDDGPHTYISIKFPLFDATGVPYAVCGISTDITERKRLEEQFRQSQKMEAIGRLAGGVAHDFNNLLTIIMGYNDLLLRQISHLDPIRKDLEEIKKAGERAISLTRQLLAFSRKQILQPQVLNLNVILADMNKMLRRLIGEDIDLMIIPDPALGSVKADPGQIEQVIMNLAVNARDAMPQGGRLIIETANVELDETYAHRHMGVQAGPYVMLAVSDTGSGIDKETQSRLFEPFFTTKEQGKGTGLGLSTVYGIVKQSGGNIWVYSEPGQGTTFKVYLPRVEEVVKSLNPDVAPLEPSQVFETILVVEDEEMVRDLICRILRRNGYTVLEARHGSEALLVCEQHAGPIHLMMTDVVMPGMSGRELAERLTPFYPKMKILYMSGYTDHTVVHHGVLAAGTAFLQKPFTPDVLLNKVQEVLDRSQEKPGANL